jgi:hypothetical protein
MLNEVTENEKIKFDEQCRVFVNDLNTIRKTTNNKFFQVSDYKKNKISLYTSNNQIYKPLCKSIYEIELTNKSKCYYDIPVSFDVKYDNDVTKNVNAFMTNDKILTDLSFEVKCSNVEKFIPLPSSKSTLIYSHHNILIKENENIKYNKLNFINFKSNIDLSIETESLLDNEEIKLLYQSAKKAIEKDGIWFIIGMNETTAYELYSNVNLFVDKSVIMVNSFMATLMMHLKRISLTVIIIIICILIFVLILICYLCIKKCRKNKKYMPIKQLKKTKSTV